MPQHKIINSLLGTLNMDVNPSKLGEGDYVNARNMRIGSSEAENEGCGETVKSTLEIVNGKLIDKTGRFKTIGSASYEAESLVYYFVKDTQKNTTSIYEFDLIKRVIVPVLDGLTNIDRKISSAKYFNDMLAWTDTKGDPRLIFVSLAKSGYSYNDYATTTLIKFPPTSPITFELKQNTPKDTHSFISSNQFQFIYRYVFVGNQVSVWSEASGTCAVPANDGTDKVYDYITLTLPSTEIQSAGLYVGFIQYIEIAFRTDDTQPYSFFKRVQFPSVKTAAFTVDFYNDSLYSSIGNIADAPYDNVPLATNSIEFAENRFLLGCNTYNYPEVFNLTAVSIEPTLFSPVNNGIYFLQGGEYQMGVELLDTYDRKSFVYVPVSFKIPNRNGAFMATKISVTLSGELPYWVVRWIPVIGKCANKSLVTQAHITVVEANATHLTFNVDFPSPTPPQFTWAYDTGDQFSLLTKDSSGNPFGTLIADVPLHFNTDTASGLFEVLSSEVNGIDFTGITTGALVEFASPQKDLSVTEYFEFGLSFPVYIDINGKKFFGSDNGGSQKILDITGGDTFYQTSDTAQWLNMNPINFNKWFHGIGRVNTIEPELQVKQKNISEIAFTNPYIQGTKLNGLNTVPLTDSSFVYGMEFGEITKLTLARAFQQNGSVLLVTTKYNNYSVYLGKVQYTSTDGNTTLGISNQLLGNANLLAGGWGSIHPESVYVYNTHVYGWDGLKGVRWRYAQDGITPISTEYGAHAYSFGKSKQSNPNIDPESQVMVAAHDPYFDESLQLFGDNTDMGSEVFAFNEDKNGFSMFYDMNPDWMCNINGMTVFWKNGVLYLGRAGSDYNTLLDKHVISSASLVSKLIKSNTESNTKGSAGFNTMNGISLWVYSQDLWDVKVNGIARTRELVQQTDMKQGEVAIDEQEDAFRYPVLLDQNEQEMKSRYFVTELSIDTNILTVLYGTCYTISESPQNP